jgi:hypothetical protein
LSKQKRDSPTTTHVATHTVLDARIAASDVSGFRREWTLSTACGEHLDTDCEAARTRGYVLREGSRDGYRSADFVDGQRVSFGVLPTSVLIRKGHRLRVAGAEPQRRQFRLHSENGNAHRHRHEKRSLRLRIDLPVITRREGIELGACRTTAT